MQLEKLNWLRSNLYVPLIGGYFIIVLLTYVYFGVLLQSALGVISLALLPVTIVLGRAREFLRDWSPFLALLLSYEALQGIAGSLASSRGILSVYPYDKMLWGMNLTGQIQLTFYSEALTDIATTLYSLHFPLVAILATLLWYSNRSHFRGYVYALLISSYFSLLVFLAMPTAPPWYVGVASDIIAKPSSSTASLVPFFSAIDNLTKSIESDKFAAFPSLHAAYALLFGYYATRLRYVYGLVAIPVTIGILFSTLYLGQHYLIDLIGGGAVAASAIIISNRYLARANKGIGALERRRKALPGINQSIGTPGENPI